MKYNYKLGADSRVQGLTSHLFGRVLILGSGALVGFYMGAMVVIGQIQAAVPQLPSDSLSSLSVEPVTVQRFADVTEPSDVQPSLGVALQQPAKTTDAYQSTEVVGQAQPAARCGVYQRTTDNYQMQGERE